MTLPRLSVIAIAGLCLAACTGPQIDKVLKTIQGTYEPTADEIAAYSQYRLTHSELPEYTQGSAVVSEIIVAEQSSSIPPYSSEASSEVVAVVEPSSEPYCEERWRGNWYTCGLTKWLRPVEEWE